MKRTRICRLLITAAALGLPLLYAQDEVEICDEAVDGMPDYATAEEPARRPGEVPVMFRDDALLDDSHSNQELGINIYTAPSISKIFAQLDNLPAIPEEYVPLFNAGIYKPDSFARLPVPGAANQVEWTATYLNVEETYGTEYVAKLLSGDWKREGTYEVEGDPKATIEVLYRPLTAGSKEELGLVVKTYANHTVEWALFLS
jgi:hypothetical protein